MYVYRADTWCDICAERIKAALDAAGAAPADPDNEYTWDSGDYPKGPYPPCTDHDPERGPDYCGGCGAVIGDWEWDAWADEWEPGPE